MSARVHSALADMFFAISSVATIGAWQEQFEWGLRIIATIIAIIAGIMSLIHHRSRNKRGGRLNID